MDTLMAAGSTISGDPGALEAAADLLALGAQSVDDAGISVGAHGRGLEAGWTGRASDAAVAHLNSLGSRAGIALEVATAAKIALRDFAAQLRAAQQQQVLAQAELAAGQAAARAAQELSAPAASGTAGLDPTATPGLLEAQLAQAKMSTAVQHAGSADGAAAALIDALTASLADMAADRSTSSPAAGRPGSAAPGMNEPQWYGPWLAQLERVHGWVATHQPFSLPDAIDATVSLLAIPGEVADSTASDATTLRQATHLSRPRFTVDTGRIAVHEHAISVTRQAEEVAARAERAAARIPLRGVVKALGTKLATGIPVLRRIPILAVPLTAFSVSSDIRGGMSPVRAITKGGFSTAAGIGGAVGVGLVLGTGALPLVGAFALSYVASQAASALVDSYAGPVGHFIGKTASASWKRTKKIGHAGGQAMAKLGHSIGSIF